MLEALIALHLLVDPQQDSLVKPQPDLLMYELHPHAKLIGWQYGRGRWKSWQRRHNPCRGERPCRTI
jgi:hypothetical protein